MMGKGLSRRSMFFGAKILSFNPMTISARIVFNLSSVTFRYLMGMERPVILVIRGCRTLYKDFLRALTWFSIMLILCDAPLMMKDQSDDVFEMRYRSPGWSV